MDSTSSNRKTKLFLILSVFIVLIGGYSIFSSLFLQNSDLTKGKAKIRGGTDSVYYIKNDNYGFTNSESDLNKLVKASKEDNIGLINSMLISNRIKKFPAGKKVKLIEQGFSYILIEDPETGDRYFGVSESIY